MSEPDPADPDLLPFADPAYWTDPYPYYDRVRELTPVYESPSGLSVLTRYADVVDLIRDSRTSALEVDFGVGWRFHDSVLGQDPPDHVRLRRVFSKWFTSERVKTWAADTQQHVDAALARAELDGGLDLVDDLAFPATFGTISLMFGVPTDAAQDCRHHTYNVGRALAPGASADEMALGEASFEWYAEYVCDLIAAKRHNLGDDMLSAFIAAERDGTMSEAEVLATMMLLYSVGFLDNTHLITNGILQMLRDPRLRKRYLTDPAIRPNAVLEILRHETSEQFVIRAVKTDVEVSGRVIAAGSVVMMLLGAGNRDPSMFAQPEVLDFDRANVTKQLGFGGGIHSCIGFALARAQGEIGMTSVLSRYPNLALADEPEFGHTEFLRVISHLPVLLGSPAR